MRDAIGGYLGLELSRSDGALLEGAYKFQTGRAALVALLLAGAPRRVWIPRYICPVVADAITQAGVSVMFYSVNSDSTISEELELCDGDWVICVNYFGVSENLIRGFMQTVPANQLVIDASQALFSVYSDCLGVFYSPRKFVGVPDGGYLTTNVSIPMPDDVDTLSVSRMLHLLKRIDQGAEYGYRDFREAEASFEGEVPKQMSLLTRTLLASINYKHIAARRRENYEFMQERLLDFGECTFALSEESVPLCYPVVGVNAGVLRLELAAARVYCPNYWPGLVERDLSQWERTLYARTLFLPCDQRYGPAELTDICDLVCGLVG